MLKQSLILLVAVAFIEMFILIKIGALFGVIYTILLVTFTAVLGIGLVHQQGLNTLTKIKISLNHGYLPAAELVEGLILLIAGVLLLIPGFLTDIFGFMALMPIARQCFAHYILSNFFQPHINIQKNHTGSVIEGEYWKSD